MEPLVFRRGKDFHNRVQADWLRTAKGGRPRKEHVIVFGTPPSDVMKHVRRGRLDLFVDELGGFVSVVEIKSTNWDRIDQKNRQRLLASHRRQVWDYIEKYLDQDKMDVCPGIIYPRAPETAGLRERVEEYLNGYGLQVVWYDD